MGTRLQRFEITFPVSIRTSDKESGLTAKDIEDQLSFQDLESDLLDSFDASFEDWTSTGGVKTPSVTVHKVQVRKGD